MNWLYSFITAFALIFTMPFINNFDTFKIIARDIKDSVIKELSTSELSQIFDVEVAAQILDGSFFFGDGEVSGDSSSNGGGSSGGAGESSGNDGGSVPGSSSSGSNKLELTDQQKKYQKQLEQRYKESVSARTMLLLASEVYTGAIRDIMCHSMPLKKNAVEGWSVVARYPQSHTGKEKTNAGTSATLWVNSLDKETYCLSIAGTDQLTDMLQYIPMETSTTRSQQQKDVHDIAKSINGDIQKNKSKMGLGNIKKLFLTGHSLGAFLAMSLGTDLIDSSVATSKGTTTHALTKVSDISSSLNVKNVYTYTFAGPGLLKEIPKNIPAKVRSFLNVGDTIPAWSKEKLANNKAGKYNNNLIQYTNTRDVVPNLHTVSSLLKGWDGLFVHLGKEYETTSKKYTLSDMLAFVKRFDIFEGDSFVTTGLNSAAVFLNLQYHLACTYLEQLDKGQFTLVS